MNRPLKACLAGFALAFAASPALADGWRSTPWPNVSEGGNRFCFVSYHAAPRLFSVTAMADGALLSIVDPAFNGAENGEEVVVLFPSGWQVSGRAEVLNAGYLLIVMDMAAFHRALDELEAPGALTISAGGTSIMITVPDQLEGRIRNLRGPLPEGSPLGKSCLEQLVEE